MLNYTLPQIVEVSDILGYANEYAGGKFVLMILVAIWVILFGWFKKYETKTAITGATTVTFIISLPLYFIKFHGLTLLAPQIGQMLLVLVCLCGLWLHKSEN